MNFHQHIPAAHLAQHIDVMMYYTDYHPDHSIQRVVPTGGAHLIIELDGFTRHTYNNETLQPNADHKDAWLSGQHKNHISISAHENSSMFVIVFNATGAYPFLLQPMEVFTEKVTAADKIFGEEIHTLREKLVAADTVQDRFAIAEAWLNDKYDDAKQAPQELEKIIAQLQKEPVARLNDVIESFPHSQKHLINLFKKHVGLTPKYYQRIIRFNEILQRIQHKEKIAWTDIAYSCGYSDQSHFIKEFKHFSGFNPSEFIEQSHNQQSNFFPMDKG